MTQTTTLGSQPQTLAHKARLFIARRTEGRAVGLLVLVATFAAFEQPLIFTSYQVTLGRVALIGLVALGLTAVILLGELDLSVASTLAVSGVVMASVPDVGLGILAGLATGLVIGLINAFFVVVVGINSFIATLGMLFAFEVWPLFSRAKSPSAWQTKILLSPSDLPSWACSPRAFSCSSWSSFSFKYF
jgi:ribose/xylose/arabinose/galactoside ABC-type transport system permease subunit